MSERKDAKAALVEWSSTQDRWVRALVSEVIATRRPIREERLPLFWEMMLQEKGLASGDPVQLTPVTEAETVAPADEALSLDALAEVENVNALAPAQEIAFNARMTVLYGENGVGKTGYVRILKSAASVRTAEVVLANVMAAAAGGQRATIRYSQGGKQGTVTWEGKHGVAPLTRMDVFDSSSVDLHVDGALTYVFTPADLGLFAHVHDGVKWVKDRLESTRKEKAVSGNPYIAKFSRDGVLFTKIETLGATTDLAELERLAQVTPEERELVPRLQEKVEALQLGASEARLKLATNERRLLERVVTALELCGSFDATQYAEALVALQRATEDERKAAAGGLGRVSVPGVGSDEWSGFIQAADAYAKQHVHAEYPRAGDACIYCRQELQGAAKELVLRYREVLGGAARAAVTAAEKSLAKVVEGLGRAELSSLSKELEELAKGVAEPPTWLTASSKTLRGAEAALRATRTSSPVEWNATAAQAALEAARSRHREANQLVDDLQKEADGRKKLLDEASADLLSLRERVLLGELMGEIRERVSRSTWAQRAEALGQRFTQVTRSLTERAKDISTSVLNSGFEAAFQRESEALRAPKVQLNFPGRDAQAARRKSLGAKIGLSTVLSEGEQKVIALADFLAEVTLRPAATPLVFDDPVTSLDYRRIEYVVNRLVELSKARQVIVFTHNILFTMKLLACFEGSEKKQCNYYDVRDEGGRHGLVSKASSPKLDTWGDRRDRLEKVLTRARSEKDSDMRQAFVEMGYDSLRGACEILVEACLLKEAVRSYNPNVMVDNLMEINLADFEKDRAVVCEMFKKACRYIASHKQPLETLNVRPRLDELEADWRVLQEVQKRHKR